MINSYVAKSKSFTARINENGRIVIPAAIREQLGLKAGDAVIMEIENGVLRIEPHRAHILKIQKEFSKPIQAGSKLPPDQSMSDQLIEDREEEATQETEQWLG